MTVPVVTLSRGHSSDKVTLGMLQIAGEDHEPIYTLENPWKDNKPYVSCIPADSYACRPYSGTKYKNVYIVDGVPQRSGILFHHGNFEEDTSGCILLGLSAGKLRGEAAVKESKKAMDYFRLLIGDEQFILIIKG